MDRHLLLSVAFIISHLLAKHKGRLSLKYFLPSIDTALAL
jgi:hypothetical protein